MLVNAPWTLAPELGALLLVAVLVGQPRRYRVTVPLPLVLLLAWMTLSVLWSLAPMATVREVVRIGLLMAGAWLLLRTQGWIRSARLVGAGTTLLCLVCLADWALNPAEAYTADGLKGVLPQNNSLGYVAAVAVTALVMAGVMERWRKRLIGLALIAVFTLVASESMTSIVACGGALLLSLLIASARRWAPRYKRLLVLELVVVAGLVLSVISAVSVTGLVGRDATLTGRTDIWPEMVRIAGERWPMGWGQGAPWVEGSWIREWSAFHFDFPMISTHNALLDTYLQLGLVGVVLVVVLWARALLVLPALAWTRGVGLWALALAILHLTHGQAESSQGAPLTWLLVSMLWMVPARTAQDRAIGDTASQAGRAR